MSDAFMGGLHQFHLGAMPVPRRAPKLVQIQVAQNGGQTQAAEQETGHAQAGPVHQAIFENIS